MTMLHDLLHDVRYASRQLLRSPFFTITASLSIATGIYVAVGAFTLLNAILFKPLPVRDAGAIHHIYTSDYDSPRRYGANSYADYVSFAQSGAFDGMAATTKSYVPVRVDEQEPQGQYVAFVSSNYFQVAGLAPFIGRTLGNDNTSEIVLSYAYWKRVYHGDRSVLGRTMRANNVTVVIVGVAPEKFVGIGFGPPFAGWTHAEVLAATNTDVLTNRGDRRFDVFGRIPDGASLTAAQSRLNAIAAGLVSQYPDEWTGAMKEARVVTVLTHRQSLMPPGQSTELIIGLGLGSALVLLVLMLACTNVAALLMGRAAARQHEVAVRVSLGATRFRLIRQLLTESVLIAAAGTALSILALSWTTAFIRRGGYLDMFDLSMDWRVLLVAACTALLCAMTFGLAPARQSLKHDVRAGLSGTTSRSSHRMRGALIAAQVAASCVLVLLASNAVRSVRAYASIDPGVTIDGLVAIPVDPFIHGEDSVRNEAYLRELRATVNATPGVRIASVAGMFPLGNGSTQTTVITPDGKQYVEMNRVGAAFFEMIGLEPLRGRVFRTGDAPDAAIAVVSDAFARRYRTQVGSYLQMERGVQLQVVGVVRDVAYHGTHDPKPLIYRIDEKIHPGSSGILARTAPGQDDVVATSIRKRLRERFPDLVTPHVEPMRDRVRDDMLPLTIAGAGALGVGAIQLALSAIGLYGLLMFALHARRREIGVRLAIGSSANRASWDVMRDGLKFAAIGSACGIALCIPASIAASKLIGVLPAGDPVPFLAAAASLAAAVALAAFMPARRAAAVDPASALRQE